MKHVAANTTLLHAETSDPIALTRIYNTKVNLTIWDRPLNNHLQGYTRSLCTSHQQLQIKFCGNLTAIEKHLQFELPANAGKQDFIDDVVLLVDMFSELFEMGNVGLRLAVLTKAMCPRFHVDNVPVRLITTYYGAATEWVDNQHTWRDERGRVEVSDLARIQNLQAGQVSLFKGETWIGNKGKGVVHRSPVADTNNPRCVLTLDCV
ncbi:DUF1826 domain-containing protein [Saccharophagus degradans]|uniref:Uncharacterized protein n=1 Tax=Saccharophagus degradans (strain 2-40 / ATCC 43961 / DSM 17024) TaxID=203122 RepID=Q21J90_SACD2|nr:DUF1826 domain-containing protein [Saccharophagus degradans]ABD81239.1 conserved hypothetical protein [Saccharophagus degradans 2-40]